MPSEQRAVLGKVQAAGENLHRYLSRLLDVSRLVNRLQSGREAVVCSEFALASVFSELRYDFPETEEDVRVIWPSVTDIPRLYTDREKLVTILRNLVENAVKYGGGGAVTVGAHWDERSDTIRITVGDRGIGISADDLAHIFDPFRRTAAAVATNAQGVGLGLYIVKQFTELAAGHHHGGVGARLGLDVHRLHRPPPAPGARARARVGVTNRVSAPSCGGRCASGGSTRPTR